MFSKTTDVPRWKALKSPWPLAKSDEGYAFFRACKNGRQQWRALLEWLKKQRERLFQADERGALDSFTVHSEEVIEFKAWLLSSQSQGELEDEAADPTEPMPTLQSLIEETEEKLGDLAAARAEGAGKAKAVRKMTKKVLTTVAMSSIILLGCGGECPREGGVQGRGGGHSGTGRTA